MNLKKLIWVALLLPAMALSGCDEWKPDEVLLKNIWKETVKVTGINPNTPMPEVVFLEKTVGDIHGNILGMFFPEDNKVEIYRGSVLKEIWKERDAYNQCGAACGCDIGYKEAKAFIYNIVAHEMSHSALDNKGTPSGHQHREMEEKGYLLPVLSYINDYFKINSNLKSNRNGCQVNLSMESIEKGIGVDEEETAKPEKK